MSDKILNVRLRHAVKTEAEWLSADPVLLKGELAFSSDKQLFKRGDGQSKWSALSYNRAVSLDGLTASITELNYVKGVTGDIQIQLNNKQDKITGAASSVTERDLTKNHVVISDSNGKIGVSSITTTKLMYLSDVTGSIQAQLNNKSASDHNHDNAYVKISGDKMTGVLQIGPGSGGALYGYLLLKNDGTIGLVNKYSGGWYKGINMYHDNGELTQLTGIGFSGSGDTVNFLYLGGSYANPWLKVTSAKEVAASKFNGYTLADACARGVKSATAVGTLGWGTNNNYVPDISLIAYWNGAYTGTSSNLAYCKKGAFGTIVTKNIADFLSSSGGTVTGTLILSKTTDLSGKADNSPALIVGGTATTAHLELDNNEIQAKANGTSVGTLFLNIDGGLVNVGTGGLTVDGQLLVNKGLVVSSAAPVHIKGGCIEIYGTTSTPTAYIDFHYNASAADHTSRIIESASGTLSINGVTITTGKVVTATTFTGALEGNAKSATQLLNKKTIRTNLGSTTAASFDGTENITPGVTGTLPIANGGTSATTAAAAFSALSKITQGGYWTTAPDGISAWKYEGNDTATYSLPNKNCYVFVLKNGKSRGTALALGWTANDIAIWRNTLHDDTNANKWGAWRTPSMLTNLGSTTAANILTASPRPGVTGTLGIGNGGTGKTTAVDAANNFINALTTGTTTPVDADYFISQSVNGGTTTTTYHRRPLSALYTYIKGKTDSVYLKLSGGTVTGQTFFSNTAYGLNIKNTGFTKGNIPTSTIYWALNMFGSTTGSNARRLGMIQTWVDTSGTTRTGIYAFKNVADATANVSLQVGIKTDGSVFTYAPTVGTGSNDTNIATTAWVRRHANASNYGSCSTAAATAAKDVSCTNFALLKGAEITVKFTVTNTAANPTLNVNSTGAKAIYYRGSAISAGYLAANRTYTFRYNGTQYELVGDLNTDTNTKATQTNTTTNAAYRVVLSTNANDTNETNTLRKSVNFTANPSTGAFYAKGYDRINITGQTLDINTLTLSAGSPQIMRYIEKTSGGAANITNIPVAGQPFTLDVELYRWASTTDYISRQKFVSSNDKNVEYVRWCTNGSFTSWTKRVFTDTNNKVTQTNTTTNASYRLLFSINANDTNETNGIRKSGKFLVNPSTGAMTINGELTATKVYNAVWNDYAEYFERGESTEPGDIVALNLDSDAETYIKAINGDVVCGIHSDSYGHLIGGKHTPTDYRGTFEDYNNEHFIPVGMVGRVYCKVIGTVCKGEAIYASDIPGVGAAQSKNSKSQSFVGYACENYDSTGIGRIKVLLRK